MSQEQIAITSSDQATKVPTGKQDGKRETTQTLLSRTIPSILQDLKNPVFCPNVLVLVWF